MSQSKNKPNITRSKKEAIVRVPYNIQQVTKVTMEGTQETVYEYGEIILSEDGHSLTDSEHWKGKVLNQLNQDVQNYIYAKYDQGTQASLQAIDSRPDTPQVVKDQFQLLFSWISSVMKYYYSKKSELNNSIDFRNVNWDFTQFDNTDPEVSLESYMG